ncbi:MAG TPA: SRPBCC family protein [Longimicrobiales bacterium]|nr:SRPBCC family protein [Longimicrobiales bacterium]
MRNPEHVLRTRTVLPRPVDEVFAFFSDAGNLERITPPELGFRIMPPLPAEVRAGTLIDYRLSLFGLPFGWRTEITGWDPPFEFVDTQISGPYAQWIHRHSFKPSDDGTLMEDEVRYRLPVPVAGEIAFPLVRLQLGRIFRYRGRRIRELLGN